MHKIKTIEKSIISGLVLSLISCISFAQSSGNDAKDLASKLTNPVSDLISVPFQYNYDANIGIDKKGTSNSLIVQPVAPVKLNNDWNYILRPVIPFQALS